MKGGAWLVLAVSMLMGLGLTIGAIASRRQMRTAASPNCGRSPSTSGQGHY